MLDSVIHPPARLRICALAARVETVSFAFLREQLDVSDSVLSKHLSALESAGYVALVKRSEAARQRTWISLTRRGRDAFAEHVTELRRLAESLEDPETSVPRPVSAE